MRACLFPYRRRAPACVSTEFAHARRSFLRILENPLDATSLRWIGDDAFEIISNDGLARHALSPSWDFRSSVKSLSSPVGIPAHSPSPRSLSSFIRQLSYYNFKCVRLGNPSPTTLASQPASAC